MDGNATRKKTAVMVDVLKGKKTCSPTWMKVGADLLLLTVGRLLCLRYIEVIFPAVINVKNLNHLKFLLQYNQHCC